MPTLIPPAWQQWGVTLLRLALMAPVFRWGLRAGRRSERARNAMAGCGAGVALLATAAQARPLARHVEPLALLFVGMNGLACVGVLLILGAAWHVKGRVFTRFTVTILTAITLALLVLLTSGWVEWRYLRPAVRANYPDAQGLLLQKTGVTCGPAAAAMLLHRCGFRVSEGEMAELAGTQVFGTDNYLLARGMGRVVAGRGMRARLRWTDIGDAERLGRPFVAGVDDPYVGAHDILVTRVGPKKVWAVDPMYGVENSMRRQDSLGMWDGSMVTVE